LKITIRTLEEIHLLSAAGEDEDELSGKRCFRKV
jgi:hypothetical protein